MTTVLQALLILTATIGGGPGGRLSEQPVMEDRPLGTPDFVVLHSNDTRGYLEGCG
jgi:hypothetical protein